MAEEPVAAGDTRLGPFWVAEQLEVALPRGVESASSRLRPAGSSTASYGDKIKFLGDHIIDVHWEQALPECDIERE